MDFSISKLLEENSGRQFDLHTQFLNEQMPKVLKTIGFAKNYVRGEGVYLWDKEGTQYLDLLCGFGSFNIGRYHPTVVTAIKEALDIKSASLVQMDAPLLAGLLAERLIALMPKKIGKVFFTNSGTETVEAAIKFGRQYTKRDKIVHFKKSFHGLTTGALSICGAEEFKKGFGPLLPGNIEIPVNDLEALEAALKNRDVAIFMFEPILGKGVYVVDYEFLRQAQALCQRYGTLLVSDEIQSGMGRSGKMFAFEHSGIEPDMVLVSKSFAGGLIPCGAVAMTPDICNATFDRMERCYVQSSTFKMNALAMVAGLATLHVFANEPIVENAAARGLQFKNGMEKLIPQFECFGEVRGVGLMIGMEMQKPQSMKLKLGWSVLDKMSKGLFSQVVSMVLMEKHHILTQVAGNNLDVIKILPPLIITEAQVATFLEAFESVMIDMHKLPGPLWNFGASLVKHATVRDSATA